MPENGRTQQGLGSMSRHFKLGIKLRKFGRICPITGYKEDAIRVGSPVIVQTDRGIEFGEIISSANGQQGMISRDVHLRKVVRYATPEDIEKEQAVRQKEEKFFAAASEKIKEHELQVRVISLELLFDGTRVIVYYRAKEGGKKPNLRDLTRDLSVTFSARVDLQPLSPRDEARFFGGAGPCGRSLCCSVWLDKPKHVTVKMAKQQGLAISPTKTSGVCGRLMCCLEYESES